MLMNVPVMNRRSVSLNGNDCCSPVLMFVRVTLPPIIAMPEEPLKLPIVDGSVSGPTTGPPNTCRKLPGAAVTGTGANVHGN